jgi:hypothetical protein
MLISTIRHQLYTGENPVFILHPLEFVSLGFVSLSTTYPLNRYTFPNHEGTFADKGINYYTSVYGHGRFSTFLDFHYDLRANNVEGIRFKRGSLLLHTTDVSLEIGRSTIWLGHSYYGSLLLSNNAEPYSLVRFSTERPFRIPYIGNFDYTLFHGWPRDFKIIGHKLSWYPISWFEFNVKQTIVYSENYKFRDYFTMFSGKEANVSGKIGRADSRAGFEFVIDLDIISGLLAVPFGGKVYLEYAGEDLFAKWQSDSSELKKNIWVGPFGFELLDTGILTGIQLHSQNSRFVVEYAQNYKSHYLFHDPYNGNRPYNLSWYSHSVQPPFVNNGAIMGHHMGTSAELISAYFEQSISAYTFSVLLSKRHRWDIQKNNNDIYFKNGKAEIQNKVAGKLAHTYQQFALSLFIAYCRYTNVDNNIHPIINEPVEGTKADEFLMGITLKLRL